MLVEESSPMKRGLKLLENIESTLDARVEESSPMKRGLKLALIRGRGGGVES